MNFEAALVILTTKFNQYKAYREANPEFTNPPAFILALGAASGPGYLDSVVNCMIGGVRNADGSFGLEQYTEERYKRKCIWFCLSMDERYEENSMFRGSQTDQYHKLISEYNKSPYKVPYMDKLNEINKKFSDLRRKISSSNKSNSEKERAYQALEKLEDWETKAVLELTAKVKEPLSIIPVTHSKNKLTDHIYTDGKEILHSQIKRFMTYPADYERQDFPNFYNLFLVKDNYKTPNIDDRALTKHRALRESPLSTKQPMIDIVIGTNCKLERSPMLRFEEICKEIIEMGGFCFVYNAAFFHTKGFYYIKNNATAENKAIGHRYLDNYYFENMCDIPMFFQRFPVDRVFRIEDVGEEFRILPLMTSIPLDGSVKEYNPHHQSYGGKRRSKTRRTTRKSKTKKRRH